jgi:hypothetical protein
MESRFERRRRLAAAANELRPLTGVMVTRHGRDEYGTVKRVEGYVAIVRLDSGPTLDFPVDRVRRAAPFEVIAHNAAVAFKRAETSAK